MKNAKIHNKLITSHDIGFKIAPRINSIGRIDDPKLIIELLLEKDETKLSEKLSTCEEINNKQQKTAKNEMNYKYNNMITLLRY